jgi:hypothetical protein
MKIVKDLDMLQDMRQHKVVFHEHTGTLITGLNSDVPFMCYYVLDAPFKFEYKGKMYAEMYFDGCFYPYIVEL